MVDVLSSLADGIPPACAAIGLRYLAHGARLALGCRRTFVEVLSDAWSGSPQSAALPAADKATGELRRRDQVTAGG